jgi:hypothetical protein
VHRESKTVLLVVLVVLTISVRVVVAQASFAGNPQVTVSVYDDASVFNETLARAERRAAKIFSRVGLDVNWLNCTVTEKNGCGLALDEIGGPVHLVLRITPTVASSTSGTAFGVAHLGRDGTGRYGDVFWSRVQDPQGDSNVDVAMLLGSVMAHEMGHLLLGSNAHAVSGIMRARWEHGELRRIGMDSLLFLPEQGTRMRDRVSRRQEFLVSSGESVRDLSIQPSCSDRAMKEERRFK